MSTRIDCSRYIYIRDFTHTVIIIYYSGRGDNNAFFTPVDFRREIIIPKTHDILYEIRRKKRAYIFLKTKIISVIIWKHNAHIKVLRSRPYIVLILRMRVCEYELNVRGIFFLMLIRTRVSV